MKVWPQWFYGSPTWHFILFYKNKKRVTNEQLVIVQVAAPINRKDMWLHSYTNQIVDDITNNKVPEEFYKWIYNNE